MASINNSPAAPILEPVPLPTFSPPSLLASSESSLLLSELSESWPMLPDLKPDHSRKARDQPKQADTQREKKKEEPKKDSFIPEPSMLAGDLGIVIDNRRKFHDLRLRNSVYYRPHRNWDFGPITSTVPAEVYRASTTGNIDFFKRPIEDDPECAALEQVISPRGNSILHLAASLGHDKLVELILDQFPGGLFNRINFKGDLALHLAASGGHLDTVKSLISFLQGLPGTSAENSEIKGVLKKVNNEGKTALHVALENHHQEVDKFLVNQSPIVSMNHENRELEKSASYMAAEAGYSEIVKLIMDKEEHIDINNNPSQEPRGKPEPGERSNSPKKESSGKSVVDPAAVLHAQRRVASTCCRNWKEWFR